MRSHRWRSVQSGLPESAHGCPELVKHALFVEANGMCRNRCDAYKPTSARNACLTGVWTSDLRMSYFQLRCTHY